MMLMPKKSKYLKPFTNKKIIKHNKKQNNLKFAKICLISAEAGFIPNFQISAIKLFLRKNLKKRGQIFIRLFPNQPITKKANETRLGRGKGNLKY
jgi:large subunit ribosomal protein L16